MTDGLQPREQTLVDPYSYLRSRNSQSHTNVFPNFSTLEGAR